MCPLLMLWNGFSTGLGLMIRFLLREFFAVHQRAVSVKSRSC